MYKKILLIIPLLLLLLLACSKVDTKLKTDSELTSEPQIYIVKEFNGRVAVFQSENDSPVQILDCIIKDLPPDAVKALATGIEVNSINELQKIIEAYD